MPENDEHCGACFDLGELEEEEKPLWKERELHLLAASAILLLIGLAFEFFLKEKTIALLLFLVVSLVSGHRILREGVSALLNLHFSIALLIAKV